MKVNLRILLKSTIQAYVLSWIVYLLGLGFSPVLFRYWCRWHYNSNQNPEKRFMDDLPKDIRNAYEVSNLEIHSFHDVMSYLKTHSLEEEVVLFRNYTDCDDTFRNVVFPRRQHNLETFIDIEYDKNGNPGNVYYEGVRQTGSFTEKSLAQILEEKNSTYYATFLQLFNDIDFADLMNAPRNIFLRDSSFISHFSHAVVSTRIHSAPIINTFSLQCYGSKSWLFWKDKDLNANGFISTVVPNGVVITGSPQSIVTIPTVRAIVNPNDLLYFPPAYAHVVASTPGKNIMFAFRQISPSIFARALRIHFSNSIFALTRHFVHQFYRKSQKGGFYFSEDPKPFRDAWFEEVRSKQEDAFSSYFGFDVFGI